VNQKSSRASLRDEPDYDASWPGWSSGWSSFPDGEIGTLYFEATAWEQDGQIVAVSVIDPLDPVVSNGDTGLTVFHGVDEDTSIQEFSGAYVEPEQYAAMCDGSSADAWGDANLVLLQGVGPSVEDMQCGWTRAAE
jgi:hypothetical protein